MSCCLRFQILKVVFRGKVRTQIYTTGTKISVELGEVQMEVSGIWMKIRVGCIWPTSPDPENWVRVKVRTKIRVSC